jgi:hypothetical protein
MLSICCNPKLVEDIHEVTETLELAMTNGGVLITIQKATVPQYGKVWYVPQAITNIFSLAELEKKHHVTYDTISRKHLLCTCQHVK